MRLPLTLSTYALLAAGLGAPLGAQHSHDHESGSEGLHSHLKRLFAHEEAQDQDEQPLAAAPAPPVAAAARQGGKERGFMGVQMTVEDGAMVIQDVIEGTPAAAARLESGDRITRIGDHQVRDQEALSAFLSGFGPGDTLRLTVDRGGWSKEIELTLAARAGLETGQPAVEERRVRVDEGQQAEIKEKIRRKLKEKDAGGGRPFFSNQKEEVEEHDGERRVEVEVQREGSEEPRVRIRINGEDVDPADLDDVYVLKGLDGLKNLEHLKGLKGLEGLKGLWSDDEGHSFFVHRGDHDDDRHDVHEEHEFEHHGQNRWFGRADGDVSALREELHQLREEMRELRHERLKEVERLRKEVHELIRSLEHGR